MSVPKIEMVKVPEGSFWMGSCGSIYIEESPIHKVYISKFMISKYPVTQELWKSVMGSNPSHFEGDENLPVEKVSWDDTQIFINKLNLMTGLEYRLPTEAEWEYACKGGGRDLFYGEYNIDEVAWYDENSDYKTHKVGLKKPNILGIYDMLGNVLEWCQDYFHDDYYKNSPDKNPCKLNKNIGYVCRGGCYDNEKSDTVSIARYSIEGSGPEVGFRLARTK